MNKKALLRLLFLLLLCLLLGEHVGNDSVVHLNLGCQEILLKLHAFCVNNLLVRRETGLVTHQQLVVVPLASCGLEGNDKVLDRREVVLDAVDGALHELVERGANLLVHHTEARSGDHSPKIKLVVSKQLGPGSEVTCSGSVNVDGGHGVGSLPDAGELALQHAGVAGFPNLEHVAGHVVNGRMDVLIHNVCTAFGREHQKGRLAANGNGLPKLVGNVHLDGLSVAVGVLNHAHSGDKDLIQVSLQMLRSGRMTVGNGRVLVELLMQVERDFPLGDFGFASEVRNAGIEPGRKFQVLQLVHLITSDVFEFDCSRRTSVSEETRTVESILTCDDRCFSNEHSKSDAPPARLISKHTY
jgi:hypothetical protein